jgi:hypothetical protein
MLTIQLAHVVPTQEAEVDQVQGGDILDGVQLQWWRDLVRNQEQAKSGTGTDLETRKFRKNLKANIRLSLFARKAFSLS